MFSRAFKLSAAVIAIASGVVTSTRAAEIPKGRVLEKVACASDNSQTYALYLPTTFEPARKWPVLFCFDPGARGKVPVERFQAAAEKFGYVVAGSNNSRNGPWEANATAINAMVGDVKRFLPIDAKRLYVAGLSGGARVACTVALGGLAHGVIACSAGFPGSDIPAKVPFPFFGTAGVTDFNYPELRRVDRELDDRRAAHRVVIFEGGHEWLSSELAIEALAWFDLQAMRSGALAKDDAWLEVQFKERLARVPAEPAMEHYRGLKSLVADFKGLVADAAPLEKKVTELGTSRDVREALKVDRASERTEQNTLDNLLSAAGEGMIAAVQKSAAQLQAKAKSETASAAERAMATRVLQGAASACSESAREAMRLQDYDQAASLLEAVVVLRPERAQAHFDLARARAFVGDKKRALAALQAAITAGFKDAPRIDQEKAFDRMRADAAFVALVNGIR